jgi:hypothetical protein
VWQHRSPPEQGGGLWSHGTHGSTGAILCGEAGSGAAGRVAAPEPSSVGMWDLEPCDAWQHVDAHSALCLGLKLVRGGTWSTGYWQWPSGHLRKGCESPGGASILFPRTTLLNFCLGGWRQRAAPWRRLWQSMCYCAFAAETRRSP